MTEPQLVNHVVTATVRKGPQSTRVFDTYVTGGATKSVLVVKHHTSSPKKASSPAKSVAPRGIPGNLCKSPSRQDAHASTLLCEMRPQSKSYTLPSPHKHESISQLQSPNSGFLPMSQLYTQLPLSPGLPVSPTKLLPTMSEEEQQRFLHESHERMQYLQTALDYLVAYERKVATKAPGTDEQSELPAEQS